MTEHCRLKIYCKFKLSLKFKLKTFYVVIVIDLLHRVVRNKTGSPVCATSFSRWECLIGLQYIVPTKELTSARDLFISVGYQHQDCESIVEYMRSGQWYVCKAPR